MVTRLREAFPETIVGVKDSSGDTAFGRELIAAHGDIAILFGDERILAEGIRNGAGGAISGLANLCAADMANLVRTGEGDARINDLVDTILRYPVVPAVKSLIAHRFGDPGWMQVRPAAGLARHDPGRSIAGSLPTPVHGGLSMPGEPPRNVLLIMSDQFRFDCLGHAGHPVVQTPRLDELAAGSAVFRMRLRRRRCAFRRATVSPHGLRNGRHRRAGLTPAPGPVPELPTLMGELARRGTYTKAVGKTHFGGRHHDT